MKASVDDDNTPCNTDDDKLRALVNHNFLTKDQAPLELEWVREIRFHVEGTRREGARGTPGDK